MKLIQWVVDGHDMCQIHRGWKIAQKTGSSPVAIDTPDCDMLSKGVHGKGHIKTGSPK